MANESKDIPILVTAVTDPADAKLVKSNKKPGTNVSGTSDLTPVAKQMNLLKELIPNAKKVAMLYCSAEANSKFQVGLAKKEAKKYKKVNGVKIKFLKDGLTTTANIKVVKGQDRKYYGIITLSKYMIRYVTDRFVNIQIIDDVSKGLKIPKTSLVSKSLYVIPKSYGAEGGNSDKIGFNRQVKVEGKITNEFYYPTIAYSDKDNYYVSTALFENGDVLTAIDSSEQYIIGKTQDFVGVYNINNGYTVFVRVNILESTDEYYIVKQGDIYGLSLYDRIVLDGSTVSENQIIFQ